MFGSIAAVSCTTCSIPFDLVLPRGSQNNHVWLPWGWISKHLKLVELIKLFHFPFLPFWPGAQPLQFTTSEVSNSSLFIGDCCGTDGLNSHTHFFCGNTVFGEIYIGALHSSNCSKVSNGELMNMFIIISCFWSVQIAFSEHFLMHS